MPGAFCIEVRYADMLPGNMDNLHKNVFIK